MTGEAARTGALSPARWRAGLDRLASSHELDLLVVGGGVVGAGCALDAASRGLEVALVEARDFASGTSSRSSKLVHGGLRYLQSLDLGLVREALRERELLLGLAPHLVRPLPMLFPLRHRLVERAYVGTGVTIYDLLARGARSKRTTPRHRQLSRKEMLELAPSLRPEGLVGGVELHDAQVDDARLVVHLLRSAAENGAHVLNGVAAVGFSRSNGRVDGARVRVASSGEELEVRARVVVLAAGVWSEHLAGLASGGGGMELRPSKGVHIVLDSSKIDSSRAIIAPAGKSVLFIMPWAQRWIVGTTDTDWSFRPDHPVASAADVDYLLAEAGRVLSPSMARDDVVSVYAGLRPLIARRGASTTKLSREHAIGHPAPGVVMVSGGKLTTYRVMAAETIDAAAKELASLGRPAADPSPTAELPILGADGFVESWSSRVRLAGELGVAPMILERMLGRYGTLASEVVELLRADPVLERPLEGGGGHLGAEAVYAVASEGARGLEDVLLRRLRLDIESDDRGLCCAGAVAELIAPHLGWTANRVREEVETYRRKVAAELRAEAAPNDEAAVRLLGQAAGPTGA